MLYSIQPVQFSEQCSVSTDHVQFSKNLCAIKSCVNSHICQTFLKCKREANVRLGINLLFIFVGLCSATKLNELHKLNELNAK